MAPSNRDRRWVQLALKVACRSTHRKHQMAAIVVKGGAVLSAAANLQAWGAHAEVRALRPNNDYTDATVYVVRKNKRTSKPCPMCMDVIFKSGITSVVFVDKDQQLKRIKV